MNEEWTNNTNQSLSSAQEKLKHISGIIRNSINNLKIAKKNADNAWTDCSNSLGSAITNDINERKATINHNFDKAIERLEQEANALYSIANIWNDTESEIRASSKNIDDIFTNISRTFNEIFNNNNNNNNNNKQ